MIPTQICLEDHMEIHIQIYMVNLQTYMCIYTHAHTYMKSRPFMRTNICTRTVKTAYHNHIETNFHTKKQVFISYINVFNISRPNTAVTSKSKCLCRERINK